MEHDVFQKVQSIETLLNSQESQTEIVSKATRYIINGKDETPLDLTSSNRVVLGQNVNTDIELVKSYNGDAKNTVLDILKSDLHLQGSVAYAETIIANPIHDINILKKRNDAIAAYKLPSIDNDLFSKMKEYESDMLWMFERYDKNELDSLYDIIYFNSWLLKCVNSNAPALTTLNLFRIVASPIIGIVTPIAYIIVPYIVFRYKFKIKMSFFAYVRATFSILMQNTGFGGLDNMKWFSVICTTLLYFYGVFNNIEIATTSYKIAKFITNKMNNVMRYIQHGKELVDMHFNIDDARAFLPNVDFTVAKQFNCFVNESTKTFSIFRNFGRQLKIFKQFNEKQYTNFYRQVYFVDVLNCLAIIKQKYRLCDAEYVNSRDTDTPVLNITDFCHPNLLAMSTTSDAYNIVRNSIAFGKDTFSNMIITGPNAGGKSTLIKSILLAIIMSQSISMTCATSCKMTPFKYVNSQINIPDCKGKESLFEAEMFRSKDNFEMLNCQDGFSFIAMDEIFNSTNPVEGIAGAYAVIKKMANYSQNISVISTHYVYLTKLVKLSPTFANYKMNIVKEKDGTIVYPYKLSKGVSSQYIALELLKQNGFDQDIIDTAIEIKQDILMGVTRVPDGTVAPP